MKTLDLIAAILMVVGALNWGLVGLIGFDLVAFIFGMNFGERSPLSSLIYILVGLAGLYYALTFRGMTRRWTPEAAPGPVRRTA